MFKKIITASIALFLVFTNAFSIINLQELSINGSNYVYAYGTFWYKVNDDNTVTITDYSGDEKNLKIPSEIDGKKVTLIAYDAFRRSYSLESVEIPEGVTTIEEYAFASCDSLESVEIPKSVKEIGEYAFASCNSLKNIEISEGVTLIADNAFRCCDSLESVEIPKSVKEIGRYAFASCNSLKSIKISKGVKEIRECAFASCNSLKNIEIPEGVTLIADRAFIQCNSLKDVTIKEKNTSIGFWAFDSANYKKMTIRGLLDSKAEAYAKYKNIKFVYLDNKTTNNGLRYYVNDDNSVYITGYNGSEKNLKIPSKIDGKKVKRIVDFAFYECESLENIKIPKEVTSIGRWAFDSANYEKMTIRGVPGSTAEKYAKSKKIKFVNIYKKNIIIYTIIGIIALVLLAVVFIKRNKFRNKDNKATSKENEAISKENEATSKENKPIEAENENKELSKNKNMAINKVIFRKDKDK